MSEIRKSEAEMIPYDWLHIELMQIELFLRCAENQNFTKAAISMRVTPGMVSKRIGALESALGVTLFTREKNRVHLTEAGNNLYADLTRITEEFVQAAERVRIKEKEQDRPILFGLCDATNIDRYFLPLMYSFESEGDEPAFRIRLQKSFDMLDEISSGRIDIGFAPMFMEEAVQLHRDLSCFLALPSPLFACLSENSPLAGREILTMEELKDTPFVVSEASEDHWYLHWLTVQCRKHGFTPKIDKGLIGGAGAYLQVTEDNLLITDKYYNGFQSHSFIFREIRDTESGLMMIWRKDCGNRIRQFISHARQFYRELR